MRKLNYYGIALLPLMLASCGGNFGVQPVVESTPTAYPVTFKSKDVPTSPPAEPSVETTPVNRPAVGAAMRLLRRNTAFHREDGTAIPDSKQAEEKLSFKEGDVLFLYGSKGNKLQQLKSEIHKRDSDVEIRTSEKENKKYNYKFVDAGYVYTKNGKDEIEQNSGGKRFTHRFGYDGFVYYSGERPSQSLPSAGTVQYSGNWQYMTDVKRHRTGKAVASDDLGYITFYGNDIGATSYAAKDADDREKHPAEYTVDFDKKILKGELIKNQYVQKRNDPKEPKKPLTIYNITADLNGNRFTGSAKVNTEVKTRHADKEYLFFHTDADQRLEGGFSAITEKSLPDGLSVTTTAYSAYSQANKKQRHQAQILLCRLENTPKSWILEKFPLTRRLMKIPARLRFPLCPILVIPTNFLSKGVKFLWLAKRKPSILPTAGK